ncbi:uncharacterized protein LOC110108927, partial [Dendrobium catenatum]|uniref:uncharacterized protein LOC110108927 n=1 Tax=Dendrobium catenatum TaxID=906689 RepID=UPI0009F47E51
GVWYILGKPFIFQKWTPHFSPIREELTSVPILFKIHDLPLCCWTTVGISKIATKVGHPLAVDALTASKSRLTYARVCVQVDATTTFPEIIPICVDGKIFNLKIQYEWRPALCAHCRSLNHLTSNCSANPKSDINPIANPTRGRSKSRRPRPHSQNPKGLLPFPNSSNTIPELATDPLEKNGDISVNRDDMNVPRLDNNVVDNSNQNIILANQADNVKTKGLISEDGVGIQPVNEIIETTLNVESSTLLGSKDPTPILTGTNMKIPNLNSPTSLNSSCFYDANEAESSSTMPGEDTGDPIESTAKYKNDKLEVSTSNKLHSSDPSSQRQTRGKGNRKGPYQKS